MTYIPDRLKAGGKVKDAPFSAGDPICRMLFTDGYVANYPVLTKTGLPILWCETKAQAMRIAAQWNYEAALYVMTDGVLDVSEPIEGRYRKLTI